MTFQIGIVGTDGVLLAGDTLITDLHRYTQHGTKIFVSPSKDAACCCSGGDVGEDIIRAYFLSDDKDVFTRLLAARNTATTALRASGATFWRSNLLLAQQCGKSIELWQMQTLQDQPVSSQSPFPKRVPLFELSGDITNPCAFIIERFLPKKRKLPLDSLKLLAAHAIRNAHEINPSYVDGLEMAVCRPGDFRILGRAEIKTLIAKSKELDSEITQRLIPRSGGRI